VAVRRITQNPPPRFPGASVEFDGGMLKADEGAWSVLTDLGIVEGSEVRFKVTINGQSAEIVATVAEA
jgi:hypothetical protein